MEGKEIATSYERWQAYSNTLALRLFALMLESNYPLLFIGVADRAHFA